MLGKLLESDLVRKRARRSPLLRWLQAAREVRWHLAAGRFPVYVDYPVSPVPRYGHGKPVHGGLHDVLAANANRYETMMEQFVAYGERLRAIPLAKPTDPVEPYWKNGFIGGIDAIALYCLPCLMQSKLYLEIGSGNSTKFVRKAIRENGLETRIVSIDPHPRAEIDAICDQVIRHPLEEASLDVFAELRAGDILMVDNSHRCFQNSDVTVVFLDILPRLNPGVVIYIDDIYLPLDYPPEWRNRYYSEQYLLAVLLLADTERYEVLLPAQFVAHDKHLSRCASELWDRIGLPEARSFGNGFWMQVRSSTRAVPASSEAQRP